MLRSMCKSKIQNATVTEKNVNYSGSIKIDAKLLKEADIFPYEMILVVNLENGKRFETYAIEGEEGSGIIGLQGGAALLGDIGDKLIMSTCLLETEKASKHKIKKILVDRKNKIMKE